MDTAEITYLGELRTATRHVRSGQTVATDAPPDNQGLGAAFSPTDLLSTALPCCMITTMGIVAREKGISLVGLRARMVKHMGSDPRRVARIEVHMELDGTGLDARQRAILEHTARTCPVAISLHPSVVQDLTITYLT